MRIAAALILIALTSSTPVLAHSSARGFVLLLPTNYVILGGAFAVLATFVAVRAEEITDNSRCSAQESQPAKRCNPDCADLDWLRRPA